MSIGLNVRSPLSPLGQGLSALGDLCLIVELIPSVKLR